jgi:hypothetical protein
MISYLSPKNRPAIAAFVVAVAYWPGLFSAAYMPRWWAVALAVPLAFDPDRRNVRSAVALCLLAFLACAAASLVVSPDAQTAALDLLFLCFLVAVAFSAAGLADADPTISAFCWGVSISAALCVPQAMGWSPVFQTSGPAGLFTNSEVMAEIAAPLLVWAAVKGRWGQAALMLIPLALCHSRIAVFAAAAGVLYAWPVRRAWIKPSIFAAIVVLAAASAVIFGVDKAASGMTRLVLWGTALESIVPLGRGLGWWAFAHPGGLDQVAHSDALQYVVELGAGSIFLLIVPFLVLKRGIGHAAERAAFVVLCIEAVVSFPLHLPASGFLFALLAGSLARDRAGVRLFRRAGGDGPLAAFRRAAASGRRMARGGDGGAVEIPVRPQPSRGGHLDPAARGRAAEVGGF